MQKWESIHKLIKLTNRYRHVAVSAICFKAGKKNAVMMDAMAEQNYGHSEEIE